MRWLLALLTGLLATSTTWAQAKLGPPPEAFDIVFIQDSGPVLLRIEPRIGTKTVQSLFVAYLKKWFDFLDANHDGKLDAKELAGAPKAGTMAQLVRFGTFGATGQPALTLTDLKKKPMETASWDDFAYYFQRFNVQALQIMPTFRGAQFTDHAGEVLFKLLDTDKDGKLTRAELAAAPALLARFDLDDDEMVSAQELFPAEDVAMKRRPPPAMAMAMSMPAARPPAANSFALEFYPLIKHGERERLAPVLLSLFDKDQDGKLSPKECGFDGATFARLDKNKDGFLEDDELAEWVKGPADFDFVLQLPVGATKTRQPPDDDRALKFRSASARFLKRYHQASVLSALVRMGDVEITVQARAITAMNDYEARGLYLQQFASADKEENGYVELADLEAPEFASLKEYFAFMDRNQDGKLTYEEVAAFVNLLAEAPRFQVTLAVIEQGRAFFHLLDANRDGRLSAHEIKNAWSRLEHLDVDKKGYVTYEQIPRQFQLVAAPGLSQNLLSLGSPAMQGKGQQPPRVPLAPEVPLWFRKMDLNGDGFVSPREFLGSRADFNRIDTNDDGLIDPEEALKFDTALRKK